MKIFEKINLQHLAVLFFLLFVFLVPFFVFAQAGVIPDGSQPYFSQDEGMAKSLLNTVADSAGYEKSMTVGDIITAGINGFLALVGIIFIIYIIYSGYLWMGAPGEEQVKKAKEQIRNAIIGLLVIIGSYAIVNFVLKALFSVGGGGGTGIR